MISSDYIIGLVDGEGSFYVRINTDLKRRNKIEFKFSVKLRHQDKEILDKLTQFFGCGKVYLQKDSRPNHTDCYRFEVNRKEDIFNKIIPFFLRYPLQSVSKHKSFKVFCEIARLVEKRAHLTKKGIEKIRLLKSQMNQKTVGLA